MKAAELDLILSLKDTPSALLDQVGKALDAMAADPAKAESALEAIRRGVEQGLRESGER